MKEWSILIWKCHRRITQNQNYLNPTYYYSSTVDANDYKPVTSLPDPHSLTSADLASAIQAVRDYFHRRATPKTKKT
jgi:hypothetical protein